MAVHRGETFRNSTIQIDGNEYIGCRFEKCSLVFAGADGLTLKGNTFIDCDWGFIGPAANTVMFMTAMYGSEEQGARQLIQQTLDNIRSGVIPQKPDRPS